MATLPRDFIPGEFYHIYNRGIAKMPLFKNEQDYTRFMETIVRYNVIVEPKIKIFTVMNNHYHFIMQETEQKTITKFFSRAMNSYAKYFNIKYADQHSGRVFQNAFRSKYIQDQSYLLTLTKYIQDNPVKDGFVEKADDWVWKGVADDLEEWYSW